MRATLALSVLAAALAIGCTTDKPEDLQSLLRQRKFAALEARLADAHNHYLAGRVTDMELRLQFRAFDAMSPAADALLDEWVRDAPASYFALAVRGYHHRSIAFALRGTGWARDVGNWDVIQARLRLAEQDMRSSLRLNAHPLMSHYVLLDVAGMPCDRLLLDRYFEGGISALPGSALLYNRQLHYLKPRWCGSRAQMAALLQRARAAGLPSAALQQMEAISADDEGRSLLEQKRDQEAEQRLLLAAQLGAPFGWAFRRESLFAVNQYACKLPSLISYCRS